MSFMKDIAGAGMSFLTDPFTKGPLGVVDSVSGLGGSIGIPGMGQGNKGLNFSAGGTQLQVPTTNEQASTAYSQTQDALAQQAQFLEALKGQNGIQNQSSVYNQLQGVANGTGPNPAQAMMNNTTGANVANQAALMAGQRGSSQNSGMIARQAAQQGANIQQQAAGQGAALQAQQSLGALNQMGGVAGQQVGQQAGATTALNQATQSEQQNLLNSIAQQNASKVAMQSNINNANASIASKGADAQTAVMGGVMNGLGSAMGMAEGGEVPEDQSKPLMTTPTPSPVSIPSVDSLDALKTGPQSNAGKFLYSSAPTNAPVTPVNNSPSTPAVNMAQPTKGMQDGTSSIVSKAIPLIMMAAAHGGQVPAIVSPGEVYLDPKKVKEVASKGNKPGDALEEGEKIPGKAKVKGDSYANDTVHKTLKSGGIVLPKSVTEAPDAPQAAARFVAAILAKQGLKGKKRK